MWNREAEQNVQCHLPSPPVRYPTFFRAVAIVVSLSWRPDLLNGDSTPGKMPRRPYNRPVIRAPREGLHMLAAE